MCDERRILAGCIGRYEFPQIYVPVCKSSSMHSLKANSELGRACINNKAPMACQIYCVNGGLPVPSNTLPVFGVQRPPVPSHSQWSSSVSPLPFLPLRWLASLLRTTTTASLKARARARALLLAAASLRARARQALLLAPARAKASLRAPRRVKTRRVVLEAVQWSRALSAQPSLAALRTSP